MAPGADIISLKVLDDLGSGTFGWIESALQWVMANAAAYNIASVNMSLSDGPYRGKPFEAGADILMLSFDGDGKGGAQNGRLRAGRPAD